MSVWERVEAFATVKLLSIRMVLVPVTQVMTVGYRPRVAGAVKVLAYQASAVDVRATLFKNIELSGLWLVIVQVAVVSGL